MAVPPKIAAEYERVGKQIKSQDPKTDWGALWTLVFFVFVCLGGVGLIFVPEFVVKWIVVAFLGGVFTLIVCLIYVAVVGVTMASVLREGMWFLGFIPLALNPVMLGFAYLMMSGFQAAGFFTDISFEQASANAFAWVFGIAQVVGVLSVVGSAFDTHKNALRPLPPKIKRSVVREEMLRKTLVALITFVIYIGATVYYLGLPGEVQIIVASVLLGILFLGFCILMFLGSNYY